MKGYYRMIDRPADDAVTMEAILAPHRQCTIERMRAQSTVLCIQDGTSLNYSTLAQCEGLGDIGSNQTGAVSHGLHLHSTFVTTTEGLPIGILRAQCSAPSLDEKGQKPARERPIEEKKALHGLQWVRCYDPSEGYARRDHGRSAAVRDGVWVGKALVRGSGGDPS